MALKFFGSAESRKGAIQTCRNCGGLFFDFNAPILTNTWSKVTTPRDSIWWLQPTGTDVHSGVMRFEHDLKRPGADSFDRWTATNTAL